MSSNSNIENTVDNGNEHLLTYCNSPRCKVCLWKQLDQDKIIHNHLTGQTFTIDFESTCKTEHFVYLLTCSHADCNFQYVGISTKRLNARLAGHRNHLCSLKGNPPTHVGEHFKKLHSPSNMRIKPIQLLNANDNAKKLEDSWIIKLSTAFPYGLNERIDSKKIVNAEQDILSSKICIYKLFDIVPSARTARGRNSQLPQGGTEEEIETTAEDFFNNIHSDNFPRNIRTNINSSKLVYVKKLFLHAITMINQMDKLSVFYKHVYFAVKDLAYFNISRNFKPKKKNGSSNYMVINFVNKLVETVNIQKMLNNTNIKEKLLLSDFFRIPNVSIKYSKTIRSTITNYKNTILSNIEHEHLTCDCSNSPYKDINHNHIVTGNLNIIENNELRELLQKGLNYREQNPPNKAKALRAYSEGIDAYIAQISQRLNKPTSFFSDWREALLEKIKIKINSNKYSNFNNTLSKPSIKNYLASLHEKYVLVPVDKAANNVAVVCKKFYLQVLSNEVKNTPTFTPFNGTPEGIISEHKNVIPNEFNIQVNEDNINIPYLYWIPKFHKEVIGFRFITSSTNCTTKMLSVKIGLALKSCLKTIHARSKYDNYFKEMNDYFIIEKTETVTSFLLTNNQKHLKRSISTYDFQTLYTHIPHHQLKNNIKKFIERAFGIKGKQFLCVTSKTAFFSDKLHSNMSYFTVSSLIAAVVYLIDNSFIIYKGGVYKQVIGIPMGTNSAPHMANIYLAVYEQEYIKKLNQDNKKQELKLLQSIFRFQDDLLVLNDNAYFETIYREIYPEEMFLKKTNISSQKVNFLDTTISIFQGKFRFEHYDKRDDFNFNVISFPFMRGNLPQMQMHGLLISQLVRYCNVNSTFNKFVSCSKKLFSKLLKQDFQYSRLRKKVIEFCRYHLKSWSKYGCDLFSRVDHICST